MLIPYLQYFVCVHVRPFVCVHSYLHMFFGGYFALLCACVCASMYCVYINDLCV